MAMTSEVDRFAEGFAQKMADMVASGVDFCQVFRKTLVESIGETPAAVFLRWVNPAALEDPRELFSEVKKYFGSGAVSICRLVEESAEKALVESKNLQELGDLGGSGRDISPNALVRPRVTQDSWRSLERFGSGRMDNEVNGRLLAAETSGNKISFTRGSAFLLESDAWIAARTKLLANEAGAAMVREIWAQYGETIGLKARMMVGNATDLALDAFEDIVEDSGIAKVKFRGDKLYGTSLTMKIDSCILCAGGKRGGECAEFVGMLQGLTRALYGPRAVVISMLNGTGGACALQIGRQGGAGVER